MTFVHKKSVSLAVKWMQYSYLYQPRDFSIKTCKFLPFQFYLTDLRHKTLTNLSQMLTYSFFDHSKHNRSFSSISELRFFCFLCQTAQKEAVIYTYYILTKLYKLKESILLLRSK